MMSYQIFLKTPLLSARFFEKFFKLLVSYPSTPSERETKRYSFFFYAELQCKESFGQVVKVAKLRWDLLV